MMYANGEQLVLQSETKTEMVTNENVSFLKIKILDKRAQVTKM